MAHRLDPLLRPRSIALVGASERPGSPGSQLAAMVLRSEFQGRAYPVNPGYSRILEQPCYADLESLPEPVDHVVLATSNERLEQALGEAIDHGARAATIYSSCVLADDVEPPLLQRLRAMASESGIAVCGGNGMGFYNVIDGLYAGIFPLPGPLRPGGITYLAQSGSAFTALAHNGCRLGFNLCVAGGNEFATGIADYMDWSLEQPGTRVIALFLETVRDPQGFCRALEKAREREVPVVMLKVGRSPLGASMALTHTGAIAGNHAAYEALARRYGLIEVEDFGELMATLQLLQSPRRAAAGGLATIQESGGLMELATDIAVDLGVPFGAIDDTTRAEIAAHLEPGLKADNPLDAWGSHHDYENRFRRCLAALMRDPAVAAGMFVSNFRDGYYLSEAFLRVVKHVAAETDKPLIMTNCHGDLAHEDLCRRTADAGIPFIDGTRNAMQAVKHLFDFRDRRDPDHPPAADPEIVARWRARLGGGGRTLAEVEAMELLGDFAIPVPRVARVDDEEALLEAADNIGFPLVLKTAQPGIHHKSDSGGVLVDIRDRERLLNGYREMRRSLGPAALVCQMVAPGTEIGLGMVNDPQFGPLVMLAAGGVLIEILDDRAVGLAPLGRAEAAELLGGLRVSRLLDGVRGRPAGNREALLDLIVAFSALAAALGDRIAEIDINPVIVHPGGAIAVDALVVTR